jgi:hypothetical protein
VLRPYASWGDAAAQWNVDGTLVIDYQRAGSERREQLRLSISDPRWRPVR